MEIKSPKEIRQHEEGFFLGLSLRLCLFGALAAAPFAFVGFLRYHGMMFTG